MKFTFVIAASITTKRYLEEQKNFTTLMNATKLTVACAIIDTVLIVYINEIEEELHFLSTIIKWKENFQEFIIALKAFGRDCLL